MRSFLGTFGGQDGCNYSRCPAWSRFAALSRARKDVLDAALRSALVLLDDISFHFGRYCGGLAAFDALSQYSNLHGCTCT